MIEDRTDLFCHRWVQSLARKKVQQTSVYRQGWLSSTTHWSSELLVLCHKSCSPINLPVQICPQIIFLFRVKYHVCSCSWHKLHAMYLGWFDRNLTLCLIPILPVLVSDLVVHRHRWLWSCSINWYLEKWAAPVTQEAEWVTEKRNHKSL